MPTYVYRCKNGHTFELFHSISDESPKKCPECGARAKRVPAGGAGFLFRGSGFYATDYRSHGYREAAKEEAAKKQGGDKAGPGAAPATGGEAKPASSGGSGGDTPGAKPKPGKKGKRGEKK